MEPRPRHVGDERHHRLPVVEDELQLQLLSLLVIGGAWPGGGLCTRHPWGLCASSSGQTLLDPSFSLSCYISPDDVAREHNVVIRQHNVIQLPSLPCPASSSSETSCSETGGAVAAERRGAVVDGRPRLRPLAQLRLRVRPGVRLKEQEQKQRLHVHLRAPQPPPPSRSRDGENCTC